MGVTQNENHSPTAFHANVVAMERGHLVDRRRRPRLRALHAVRGVRDALPEHAVRRRLLPPPDAHRRLGEGGSCAGRRVGHRAAGVEAMGGGHRRSTERAGAQRHAGQSGARRRLGRGSRAAGRRRDDPVRRLRGGVLPDVAAAGGGTGAHRRRRRVRADARAVVLRRAGPRDGVRRAPPASSPSTTSPTGAPSAPGASSRSTRTTTSASPRTTSSTSGSDFDLEVVHITELVAELIRDGDARR